MGCDIREDHVQSINSGTYKSIEPDVEKLLAMNKNFVATTDLAKTLEFSQALFITVRTESESDGAYNHSQVESLLQEIVKCGRQTEKKTIIVNCNVNPGYSDEIHERLEPFNYCVNYNPEWVAQGTIVSDQLTPDLVLIGEENSIEGDIVESIYERMCPNSPAIHRMDRLSAEIAKLSLNCYLTTKITFANMVGDLALRVGANPEQILAAIGDDSRIGNKYFKHGYGYGGPCFPRDTRALVRYCGQQGISPTLCEATREYNAIHLQYQIAHFQNVNSIAEPVVFDSVAYKPGVDILEESQQLQFAVALAETGYEIIIRDFKTVCDQVSDIYGDLFKYDPT
jgi:nucleotide sugar dehydrogenase